MKAVKIGEYLVVDPRVCHGQLTFAGTRVPVHTVLVYLAKGRSIKQIVTDWPQLTPAAVQEAVQIAAETLVDRYEKRRRSTHELARSG